MRSSSLLVVAGTVAVALFTPLCTPLCTALVAQDRTQSAESRPMKSFKELNAEFDRVWGAWRAKDIAARRKGTRGTKAADPTPRYIPEYEKGARHHAGTEQAIDYLQWLLGRGWRFDKAASTAALDQLMRDHVEHPRMTRVAFTLALRARRNGFPRQKALDSQELISKKAKNPEDKAEALFWRSYVIAGTRSGGEEKKRAIRDLGTVIATGAKRTKDRAKGLLAEMTQLQVGMPAPEIEAEDLDGVVFKLSDYRGKVVFLDFWGDW